MSLLAMTAFFMSDFVLTKLEFQVECLRIAVFRFINGFTTLLIVASNITTFCTDALIVAEVASQEAFAIQFKTTWLPALAEIHFPCKFIHINILRGDFIRNAVLLIISFFIYLLLILFLLIGLNGLNMFHVLSLLSVRIQCLLIWNFRNSLWLCDI